MIYKSTGRLVVRNRKIVSHGIIIGILTLLPLLHGMPWLSLVLAVHLIAYWGLSVLWLKTQIKWQRGLKVFLYFLGIIILAINTRIFLFEICTVPSGSMRRTIQIGDHLIIDKLTYGPRMPRSVIDVPWLHVLHLLISGSDAYLDLSEETHDGDYERLQGRRTVQRGDVIIFESPSDRRTLLVKRCVALAGDTLQIINGEVKVNNQVMDMPELGLMEYQIYFEPGSPLHDTLREGYFFRTERKRHCTSRLTSEEVRTLMVIPGLDSIHMQGYPVDSSSRAWPMDSTRQWSIDYYGPIVIPRIGDSVKTYPNSIGEPLRPTSDQLGLEVGQMIIPQNYYFVMGDNRYGSSDSRIWGLVPENLIKGRASFILFSNEAGLPMHRRFLRRIH